MPENPSVSVIIPSGSPEREDSLRGLLQDVRSQTVAPEEIEVVRGVSPNGRARNQGVERTRGEILIFLDDDVRLGSEHVFAKLVEALQVPGVGLVGTAQLLPPDSTPFQRQCARQISRSKSTVVSSLTDSDMVTTQCCAIRRDVLAQVGGFHARILRGVDPELRHRVRMADYRICVAPGIWHFHPMPKDLRALWRTAWRNGYSSAFAQRNFPETVLFNPEGHVSNFDARPSMRRRLLRRAAELLGSALSGRIYGIVYDVSYALGYVTAIKKTGRSSVREH
jgi:glycosyltransferase involved in cell wall biosynthesis